MKKNRKCPKAIIIPFDNLTIKEQIKLFINLMEFADKELPPKKTLNVLVKQ